MSFFRGRLISLALVLAIIMQLFANFAFAEPTERTLYFSETYQDTGGRINQVPGRTWLGKRLFD